MIQHVQISSLQNKLLDLLADPGTDFRVKLMERLKHEIYELLGKVIDWLGDKKSMTKWRDEQNEGI